VLLARRGEAEQAKLPVEEMLARRSEEKIGVAVSVLALSVVRHQLGDVDEALDLVRRWVAMLPTISNDMTWATWAPEEARLALAGGDVDLAAQVAGALVPTTPMSQHALASVRALCREKWESREEAAAAFAAAAGGWDDFGVPYEEAQALLGHGRCLIALGRAPEALRALEQARDIFDRLGAKPALTEVGELSSQLA
jgi:tetratricopeptide (TPR) repeat protein